MVSLTQSVEDLNETKRLREGGRLLPEVAGTWSVPVCGLELK